MTRIGRYEILEELGRGGFATVYKARDSQLNRLVALKVLHEGWSNDPDFVRRFRQEAETVANLRHPHIVVVHDVGEIDRQLFIAMEFLPGEDLRRWLARRKAPLAMAETLAILEPVAGALDYAHEKGVVHRDIKPGNIMIHEKGESREMVLTDFGLVKAMESSVALTRAGQILGSPEYMAPEQADPNRRDEIGPHTDRYSLGIVAYQMLAGRVPFPGNSISTLNAHINLPVPSPQKFNEALPESVTAVLLKMLAKDPADRYASAEAFVEELRKTTQTNDQEELERHYAQLQEARSKGDWVEVVSLAARIETMQPGYRDVQQWQAEARHQLARPGPGPAPPAEKAAEMVVPAKPKAGAGRPKAPSPSQAVEKAKETPGKGEARAGSGIKPVHILGIAGGIVMIGLLVGLMALVTSLVNDGEEDQAGTASIQLLDNNERKTATADAPETTVTTAVEEATQTAMVTASSTDNVLETTVIETIKATEDGAMVTASPTRAAPPSNAVLGNTWTRPVDGMEMVYVPAGRFMMGSDQGDEDEKPVHEVSLDAFWIDQTEVTNAQYNRCVADGECTRSQHADNSNFSGDDQPVVGVSWFDAEDYCAWAGGQLPTEAQWEYAARGEGRSIYPWGDGLDCSRANIGGCSEYDYTAPVGSYPDGASWAGAYDMAGNVSEWVADWYDKDYYVDSPSQNPAGPAEGNSRVTRGGGWNNEWELARSSSRFSFQSGEHVRNSILGFRCTATDRDQENSQESNASPSNTLVQPTSTPAPIGVSLPSNAALGDIWTRPVDGMEMVYVPAGRFLMGNDQGDGREQPVHEVSLDAFWIDQTEVTNAQYSRCVADGACEPSRYADDGEFNGDDQPVVGVSWFDAGDYCAWTGVRLPTEAQWEYAARGEEGSFYPWGNEFDGQLLNYCDKNCDRIWRDNSYDDGFELVARVGSYPDGANWAGAYDMAGNVWEWVADWYDFNYYNDSPLQNPPGPASGRYRVLRGSSWDDTPDIARSSFREYNDPAVRSPDYGFRCATPGP